MCAKAARRRARCCMQAAANEWKVPVAEVHRRQQRASRMRRPAARTTFGKVAEAAAKLEPPKEIKLKDVKDWKIAGKRPQAPRHLRQAHRQAGLRHRHQDARTCWSPPSRMRRCAAARSKSFDAAKVHEHAGREEGRAGRRQRASRSSPTPIGTPRRRIDALPIVWEETAEQQGLERLDRASSSRPASTAEQAFVGHKAGDAKAAIAGAAQDDRGGLQLSLPEPRHRWSR